MARLRWLAPYPCWVALGCGGVTSQSGPLAEPIFVAVGRQGAILSSSDGVAWTDQESGTEMDLRGVAAGTSQFVAVGREGTILSSSNGRTWFARRSGTDVDLAQVTFDDGQFVAVGGGWADQAVVLTSLDGESWKPLEAPAQYSFQAVATARGTIFASAVTPSKEIPMALEHVVLSSVLPSTSNRGGWISRDLPQFSDSWRLGQGADGETLLVGSWTDESWLSRSRDGESWTTALLPMSDARAIASSSELIVVLGASTALSSADGEAWSEVELPVRTSEWLMAVGHGAGKFTAVGFAGQIFSSPDGSDWQQRDSGGANDLLDITFGPVGR